MMLAIRRLTPAASMIVLAACSSETEPPPQPTTIDTRFATPEALLDQLDLAASGPQRPDADVGAVLELVYAENAKQEQLLSIAWVCVPAIDHIRAASSRFPNEFGTGETAYERAFVIEPIGPASIVTRDGPRAKASYPGLRGEQKDLDLVQVGDRWWISAYTLEHDRDIALFDDVLDSVLATLRPAAVILPPMTARVLAGEFRSAQELRQATMQALDKYYADQDQPPETDPRLTAAIRSYVQRHR